jgi:hypothetical protein
LRAAEAGPPCAVAPRLKAADAPAGDESPEGTAAAVPGGLR